MLAEPSLAALLRGPLRAARPAGPARPPPLALVLGTALSTVVLMVVGELVPKNWAISRPLAVAKVVAGPQRAFTAAFGPFIRHLNNTANRIVRRSAWSPPRSWPPPAAPQELVALARHSAQAGALEADTAELFVRTLHLGDLTAENVMTPRVQVSALEAHATAEDVANLTRATGLSRFPVYRGSLDEVVGIVHIKDVLAVPGRARPRTPVTELIARRRCWCPRRCTVDRLLDRLRGEPHHGRGHRRVRRHGRRRHLEDIVEEVVGEVRDEHDPHRDCPTCARPARTEDGRAVWDADGAARVDQLRADRPAACPRARTRRWPGWSPPGWAASRPRATPSSCAGWRLERRWTSTSHRAARVRMHRTARPAAERPERRTPMTAVQLLIGAADPGRQRLLRRRRVRPDLRAPQPDRAARRGGRPAGPQRAVGPGAPVARCWPPPSSASPSARWCSARSPNRPSRICWSRSSTRCGVPHGAGPPDRRS